MNIIRRAAPLVIAALFLVPPHVRAAEKVPAGLGPKQTAPGAVPSPRKPAPPDLVPIGEDIPDWRARWELAKLLSYAKRYDESLAEYRKVLAEKPELAKARIEMAVVLFWAGRTGEASAILAKTRMEDLPAEAKAALIDILIAEKKYGQAEKLLRERLSQSPADDRSRLKLAEILSWTKRYPESLKEYEAILENRPNDLQLRRKYSFVLIWAGERDKAIRELRQSLGD